MAEWSRDSASRRWHRKQPARTQSPPPARTPREVPARGRRATLCLLAAAVLASAAACGGSSKPAAGKSGTSGTASAARSATPSASAPTGLAAVTGPVIFRDDFSNPANPNGWGGPNTASYSNVFRRGIYEVVLTKPHTYYWSVPNPLDQMKASLADVRIDVDARVAPGHGSAVLSIICRSNDKSPVSFYQFSLSRSPVAVGVARIVPPSYPQPAKFYRLPGVDLTSFNHYEVICRGGEGGHPVQLGLAINGKEVVNATNPAGTSPLPAGAAGVMLESFGSEPVSADFTNFVVRRVAP